MDEYISKNKLLKVIQSNATETDSEQYAQILEAILNAPTADVVAKIDFELSQHLLEGAHESIEELGKWYIKLQHKYKLTVEKYEANVKGFTEEIAKANAEIERLKKTINDLDGDANCNAKQRCKA